MVTVCLLVVSPLPLSFGRLGELRGRKRIHTTGPAFFVLGPGPCALAEITTAVIAASGSQPLGAAMLCANAPAMTTRSFLPIIPAGLSACGLP